MPTGEMEGIYSIGTRNRFDLINSDMLEDPSELIRAAQEKPKKEKELKVKGKKDFKNAKQTEKKNVKIETSPDNESSENKKNERQRSDRGRGGRGGGRGRGRGGERGGRGRGGNRGGFNSPNSPNNQEGFGFDNNNQQGFGVKYQSEVSDGFGSGFGSGSGGGFGGDGEERRGGRSGFRGRGRGGRGRGRGGNREFDRRSGSDKSSVKAFDKRDGSGSYNWGTPQDEIKDASEEHSGGFGAPTGGFGAPNTEETPAENTEQTPETEETPVEEVKDEGPQEMTFEEYKKLQSEERNKPEFNVRKVEHDKKGLKQLKKPTEEDNEQANDFFFPKKVENQTYKTSGRVAEKLNFDIRYGSGENRHMDTSRRGNRSGGRGGRRDGGFGKKRDDSSAKNAEIALGNDDEFPSL